MVMASKGTYTYDYPRPALTADCVIFSRDASGELSVLLIERGDEPYKGCWAFPGGFLEMDETTIEAASRELEEETGLDIPAGSGQLNELGCYSKVDRDPRGRVITIAYYAVIDKAEVKGSDDARQACWFPLSMIPTLAFDHAQILKDALERLQPIVDFNPRDFYIPESLIANPAIAPTLAPLLKGFVKSLLADQEFADALAACCAQLLIAKGYEEGDVHVCGDHNFVLRGGILHERVFVDHVEGVAPYMDREAAFSDVDALIALFEDLADTELSLPDEGIDGYEVRLMKDGAVIKG